MIAVVHSRGVRPNPKQEFDGYLRAELDGDSLSIRTQNERGIHFGFWGRGVRVDYELRVPPNVGLELDTMNLGGLSGMVSLARSMPPAGAGADAGSA